VIAHNLSCRAKPGSAIKTPQSSLLNGLDFHKLEYCIKCTTQFSSP
jgi:hypothetical protein